MQSSPISVIANSSSSSSSFGTTNLKWGKANDDSSVCSTTSSILTIQISNVTTTAGSTMSGENSVQDLVDKIQPPGMFDLFAAGKFDQSALFDQVRKEVAGCQAKSDEEIRLELQRAIDARQQREEAEAAAAAAAAPAEEEKKEDMEEEGGEGGAGELGEGEAINNDAALLGGLALVGPEGDGASVQSALGNFSEDSKNLPSFSQVNPSVLAGDEAILSSAGTPGRHVPVELPPELQQPNADSAGGDNNEIIPVAQAVNLGDQNDLDEANYGALADSSKRRKVANSSPQREPTP